MNRKTLALGIVIIGALFIGLGAYQLNQYATTEASTSLAISKLNEFSQDQALLTQMGMTQTDLDTSKQYALATLNSFMTTAIVDFVFGIVFLFAGYYLTPKEAH